MPLRLTRVPYRLPLRRAWHTSQGLLYARRGWLLCAEWEGYTGFGDCAPLPEAGTETAAQAEGRLEHWQAWARVGVERMLDALDADPSPAPAADCAVETALLDLVARRRGLPLRRLLRSDAADRVEVNAMLGAAGTLTDAAVEQALAAGFRILKLKVGTGPLHAELAHIEAAAARLPPGAKLRLDANRAWDRATAAAWLGRLGGLPIDCLEEPLAESDDTALAALQDLAAFSLALDESLAGRRRLDPRTLPVRRLVLKPAVLGGLRSSLRLAEQAQAAGREAVVTGVVESAAGLWAAAQLAAATGSPLAHGLATSDWLTADLGRPPVIEAGMLQLPDTPGSGFTRAAE